MKKPRIYVDFHNADTQGRLRLNCTGTIEDLALQRVALRTGQALLLYSEDLEVEGMIAYSTEEKVWVALIDWNDIHERVQTDQMLAIPAD